MDMHIVCSSSWCYYSLIVFFSLCAQLCFIGVVKVHHAVFSLMEIFLYLHGSTLWNKDLESTWLTVQYSATVSCVMHSSISSEARPYLDALHQETRNLGCVLRPHTNPWRKEEIIRARRSEECKYYFPNERLQEQQQQHTPVMRCARRTPTGPQPTLPERICIKH